MANYPSECQCLVSGTITVYSVARRSSPGRSRRWMAYMAIRPMIRVTSA